MPRKGGMMAMLEQAVFFAMFPLQGMLFCAGAYSLLLVRGGSMMRGALAAYLAWIFIDRSPDTGGWEWTWRTGLTHLLRGNVLWRLSEAGRGPLKMVRTVELPPENGPYIFASHPHGIIGVAPMTNFGTTVSGFADLFPKIRVHLLGASAIFRIPFFREWCLLHGHASVAKASCMQLLSNGHSIALAPGGARESLESTPGTMRLILKRRRGFAKLALATGAAVVPVLSFGENELYDTLQFDHGSWGRWFQRALQSTMGFAMPIFIGRSWLFPFMPKKHPIFTVVGAPVRPDKAFANESEEAVSSLHTKYCDALRELFDKHKAAHGLADAQLELV